MKASFSKDNHKIVVKKQLSAIQLIVDDKICAEKEGFLEVQITNYELKGFIKNDNGTDIEVVARFKFGLVLDTVTLFYNGEEIGTAEML